MVNLRKRLSHANVRSITHRCLPNFSLLSIPRLAIRGVMPRFLRTSLLALESYPLSACILSGLLRGRPRLLFRAGMASTISSSIVVSAVLAPVHFNARGIPLRQTTRWRFVPGFPLSVGFLPVASSPFLPLWRSLFVSPKRLLTNLSHLPG
jgi:hypothetical protein